MTEPIRFYGTQQCRHCRALAKALDARGIEYEELDITELQTLKAFIKLRDTHPAFEGRRGSDKLGIPCIVTADGLIFEWETLPELAEPADEE